MPDFHINLVAVLLAVVANFVFGFVWYTLLFGRAWAVEMGYDPDAQPDKPAMLKGMGLMILGNFLLAWVLAYTIAAWNPATWGAGDPESSALGHAAMVAYFVWLGFVLPLLLSGVAWEKKSWKLFTINAVYQLLALLLVATILTIL